MTLDASAALPYGKLEMLEVYFEHDGPRFFATRAVETGINFLAFCIEDDEESDETVFLYLALSDPRFRDIRSGHVGLRQAFEEAAPWQIWRVVEDYSGVKPLVRAEAIRLEEISPSDLPTTSARLQIDTAAAPGLNAQELTDLASQSLRTVVAVELEASDEHLTEFPLRGLGAVGTALQDSINALAQEVAGEATERGPIPASITNDVQMSTVALRAASFALVLATDMRGRLIANDPLVEQTMEELVDLVRAGADPTDVVTTMRRHGARARSKFTNLLQAVFAHQSGIGIISASQDGSVSAAKMSAAQVVGAITSIKKVEATSTRIEIPRGTLLASHTRRRTFEIFDNASGTRYAGTVSSDAQTMINGLPVGDASFVSAVLREEIEFAAEDQETGRSHILVQIETIPAR